MVVIAVSGVGGTGKTMSVREFDRMMKGEYKVIHLNGLAAKVNAYRGYDKKRKSKIIDMKKLKKALKKIKRKNKGKNIIFESIYAHEMDADIVIILRCRPDELKKRLKRKYEWKTKIVENVEAELMGIITEEAIAKHGKDKVFEIDTTEKTHRNTAFIIRLLSSKKSLKKYSAGKINWMNNKRLYKSVYDSISQIKG